MSVERVWKWKYDECGGILEREDYGLPPGWIFVKDKVISHRCQECKEKVSKEKIGIPKSSLSGRTAGGRKMRIVEYLSPTSFSLWKKSKEDFYVRYLSEVRMPREPQTEPMALGAAVDGLLKNYLFERIYGDPSRVVGGERFGLEAIIEAQVEERNRDRIMPHAKYVFEQYRSSGALADLLTEVNKGSGVRMEFDLKGVVNGYREPSKTTFVYDANEFETSKGGFDFGGLEKESHPTIASLTLLGKPDLSFITADGVHVVLDWKVNGYYSKWNTSPMKGYCRLRTAGETIVQQHRGSYFGVVDGIMINIGDRLDDLNQDWATQLSVYSWLTGSPVGSEDFIVGIHQMVCNGGPPGLGRVLPNVKIAEHMGKVSEGYQIKIFNQMVEAMEIIESGWIFREMSEADSRERCKMIDQMNERALSGGRGDDFLEELLR